MMLKPPPSQYDVEREIRELLNDGDITLLAGYLKKSPPVVSKMLSQDVPESKSPFYRTIEYLWALDMIDMQRGDQVISIIARHRMMWLPSEVVITNAAEATEDIGNAAFKLAAAEISGASKEVLLKDVMNLERAVEEKRKEINAR